MFLSGQSWCTTTGGQRSRGSFLMLFTKDDINDLRCLVRYVEMSQCGHFMMGEVKIKHNGMTRRFTLSGTYGSDGLTMSPDKQEYDWDPETEVGSYSDPAFDIWPMLHRVPKELVHEMWHGSPGHNSSGSEGPGMHRWANDNIYMLRKLRRHIG